LRCLHSTTLLTRKWPSRSGKIGSPVKAWSSMSGYPPPRKLLLSSPVLQVVNANTVKDRYLLLFTDMLVIAKPLIEDHALTGEPILPDLDGHFLVKSVGDRPRRVVREPVHERNQEGMLLLGAPASSRLFDGNRSSKTTP
jgi:hypothetical protein